MFIYHLIKSLKKKLFSFLNLIISVAIMVFMLDPSFQAWYFEFLTNIGDELLDGEISAEKKNQMCQNIYSMLSHLTKDKKKESEAKCFGPSDKMCFPSIEDSIADYNFVGTHKTQISECMKALIKLFDNKFSLVEKIVFGSIAILNLVAVGVSLTYFFSKIDRSVTI